MMNKLIIKNFLFKKNYFKYLSANISTNYGNSKTLEEYLNSRIKFKGPLTVAEYMKEALGNPLWVFLRLFLKITGFLGNYRVKSKKSSKEFILEIKFSKF